MMVMKSEACPEDDVLPANSPSSSVQATIASMQMSNEYWRVHINVEEESLYDDAGIPRGLVGLYNLGNSCYMNAAVQSLSNCPPLREYFRTYLQSGPTKIKEFEKFELLNTRRPVADAFRDLIGKLWSSDRISCFRPTLFTYRIKDRYAQFKGYTQQDAQEFIHCFLDILDQELRRPILNGQEEDVEKGDSRRQSLSSSCSSSQDGLNVPENADHFETADSGLSSDAGDGKPEELPRPCVSPFPSKNPERNRNVSESLKKSAPSPKKNVLRYRSIITDVFDGELISTVKCLTCHHLSDTKETFQDISLSIPTIEQINVLHDKQQSLISVDSYSSLSGSAEASQLSSADPLASHSQALQSQQFSYAYWIYTFARSWFIDPWLSYFVYIYRFMFSGNISLEDCLCAFFSADLLHGEDMYSCGKCKKLRNGVKQCRLTRLPEILCIHLKRFRHEFMYNSKIGTRVTFPLCDLDLRPFMNPEALEQNEEVSTMYDLVAFVSHRGAGVEFGHYVAFCRNDVDGCWYEYDDAIVTQVSEQEVMSREAYVLFYQKRGTTTTEDFKEAVMEALNEIKEPNSNAYFISAEWLYRFRTFAEPGPITNSDFLCEHMGLAPLVRPNQVLPIPVEVWEMLHKRYGGGPPCDRISPCTICPKRFGEILK